MDSQVPGVLAILKEHFKLHSMRYTDVAKKLDVSEVSVKRYMSGKGLTLAVLERLCEVVNLQLSDLTEALARDAETRPRRLTFEQEAHLVAEMNVAFAFYLLRMGWTAKEISAEFGMDDIQIFKMLRALERIGLIEVLPHNRVKLRVARYPEWLPNGPVRRAMDKSIRLVSISPETYREMEAIKLTNRGIARVRDLLDHFKNEVRAIAATERSIPGGNERWYSVMCMARFIDADRLWETSEA